MKAVVSHDFGPPEVLHLEEIEKPTPREDQVLIRVRAAALNPLDWRLMRGGPAVTRAIFRMTKMRPTTPGRDFAGEVEAVGKDVTQLKPGDAVFGVCLGSLAEYACARASKLASKPAGVTFEQAASLPIAGLTALQGLRDKGNIREGQRVLINGAGGGIGTFAVQIAKSYRTHVTGVCSPSKLELVRSIGADDVVDYTREDFTKSGQRYDLILDCVGNRSASDMRRVLKPRGICVIAGAGKEVSTILARIVQALVLTRFASQTFVIFITKGSREDLATLADLVQTGKVTPIIEKRYNLTEARDAIRYLEEGHARGKVVVTLD
jgi:NADPH:quinone reductase-like Zn-dependent oxidoreductase